nr:hypothetical protein [uncultured Haemophilus sp.]
MAGFSPYLAFVKANIKKAVNVFTIDKTARFWATLPDELKAFTLRAAKLPDEPKYWGGYSTEERKRIRNTFLTFHELDKLRLVMEKEDKRLEERINKPDEVLQ